MGFFILSAFPSIGASDDVPSFRWENEYTISIYDYPTGELLTDVTWWEMPFDEVSENVPYPWPLLEWDGGAKGIAVVTNSKATRIDVDRVNMRLFIRIEGESGTRGKFILFVSETVIASPERVSVSLDNQPIEFTIGTTENLVVDPFYSYFIRVEYTHSSRLLLFDLGAHVSKPAQPAQPSIVLAVIFALVVAIIGAVYWLKFRR